MTYSASAAQNFKTAPASFLVNTVVHRGDLSGDPTFHELLARTATRAREAYRHRDRARRRGPRPGARSDSIEAMARERVAALREARAHGPKPVGLSLSIGNAPPSRKSEPPSPPVPVPPPDDTLFTRYRQVIAAYDPAPYPRGGSPCCVRKR